MNLRISRLDAVGILRRIKTPFRAGHVPQDIVENILGDIGVKGILPQLEGLEITGRQLGLVVEHLFKMGHPPLLIHRIAVKAAAEMVVHPAGRHLAQGHIGHVQGLGFAGARGIPQQKIEEHRPGKLGRRAKAAEFGVVFRGNLPEGLGEDLRVDGCCPGILGFLAEMVGNLGR